ncbi:DUF6531 domain-containing protein, partial [Desulfurivibrio dismutans]|uniref:DUF6531 domain-containing protein n=1 Tax=Desulfurivibrio dismutans TaxID=1398908 RepID=UPI0023DB4043
MSATAPSGTVSEPFDIVGSAIFKPTLSSTKGRIDLYIKSASSSLWGNSIATKVCETEECSFSYQEIRNTLMDRNHGDYEVRLRAIGGGVTVYSNELEFSVDKTPTVTTTAPSGTVSNSFDVTGTVTFKPTLNATKGTIFAYIRFGSGSYRYLTSKSCTTEECSFSYQEITGNLLHRNPGGPYYARLVALGGGVTVAEENEFYVEDCELDIENFSGGAGSIDPASGGVLGLSAEITGCPDREVAWELSLIPPSSGAHPGQIAKGDNRHVEELWNGKTALGGLSDPGNYTLVLNAWVVDDPSKGSSASLPVRVTRNDDCNLNVTVGSKANFASGNLSFSRQLFAGRLADLPTGFDLHYNSLSPDSGVLGRGWSHNYELQLIEHSDSSVLIKNGGDGRELFTPAPDGGYLPPAGNHSLLTKHPDHTFTLLRKSGVSYLFAVDGRLTAVSDRNGNALSFAYLGGLLVGVTDSAGRSTSFSYDALGKLAAVTDPGGRLYSFQIVDDLLLSVTYPDGHGWSYLYDDRELLIAKIDPLGATTQYYFDEQRRLVGASDPEGRSRGIAYAPLTAEPIKTALVTEQDGQVWRYTYDSHQGLLLEKRDPLGGITRYLYDDQRNPLAETDPAGNTTYFSHDPAGNLLAVTDPLDQTTRFSYNHFHQVTQFIDPENRVTGYQYDARGNLIAVTDPAGAVTQISVDGRGYPSALTDPTGRTVTMNHDPAGNLLAVTDPAGATTSYQYDQLGRLIEQIGPGGETTTIAYDDRDNPVRITDSLGQAATAAYDPAGNLLYHIDPNGHTTSYQYDTLGRMI